MSTPIIGAAVGILAGAGGVGAGEAVAASLTGVSSPVVAVANRIIDWTPRTVKEFAIERFGTLDKPILLGSILAGLVLFLAVAGWVGVRRPRVAVSIFALLIGLVAVLVCFDRTSSAAFALRLAPVAVMGIVAIPGLGFLLAKLARRDAAAPPGFDRRSFLLAAVAMGTVGAGGVGASRTLLGRSSDRTAVRLPLPVEPAAPLPAGTTLPVTGISSYITPNATFYRVDTAVSVPRVPIQGYALRIGGLVDRPIELSYAELLDMPLIERRITLTCVSQPIGGPYVGNATWLGVRTADLFSRLGIHPDADAVKSTSFDGMTIGTPLQALTDGRDAMIAVGMNGEPLPLDHGFPVRLVVPGLYGYVSATKWLTELEITRFADFSAYWTTRGYAEQAPIKTGSRIDVPRSFARLAPGPSRIAGVAWAQNRGITAVEVSLDDGPWLPATLAAEDGISSWRQWVLDWEATPGNHHAVVRATDGTGQVQVQERVPIAPDGATGWPRVDVIVAKA